MKNCFLEVAPIFQYVIELFTPISDIGELNKPQLENYWRLAQASPLQRYDDLRKSKFPKEKATVFLQSGEPDHAPPACTSMDFRATTPSFGPGSTRRHPDDELEPLPKVGKTSPEL